MTKRRDELRALLSTPGAPKVEAKPPENDGPKPDRAASGAVKAMGLQLGALRSGADEARQLRETLAQGERVIEVDPAQIEPALVADRLHPAGLADESFDELKESIRTGGQEVPVLLRPHPDDARAKAGAYQAAYGHRRIAAAKALGIKVRAVVRVLSDEALVLAQGKENAERRDLSFIERAFFAKALMERGFERRVAEQALAIHKTEMTRLLQVAEAVPRPVAEAIGPAPRIGRPRWLSLAELLKSEDASVKTQEELKSARFREQMSSDARFQLLFDRLLRRSAKANEPEEILSGHTVIARLAKARRGARLDIEREDFAAFVARRLPELHAAFQAEREEDG